jgi:HK97 family phage prohead protease
MIYGYKSIPAKFEDVDTRSGIVKGYFNTFDVKDSDGDITRKGAFLKSIQENGPKSAHPRIKYFLNHDPLQVPGVIKELDEDNVGLLYVAHTGTHDLGVDYLKMVESGIITEHSIGYQNVKGGQKMTAEGNNLLQVKLKEGSGLTAWGANQFTPITVHGKSETKEQLTERLQKRIGLVEKFCRNTDATDETIQTLLIEIKQMSQYILDLSSTPAVEQTPEPQKNDAIGLLLLKTKIINNSIKSI